MKTRFAIAILLTFLMIPGLAWATNIIELVGDADCYGWSATATVHFGSVDRNAMLDYTVTLMDVDMGATVDVQTGTEDLGFVAGETLTFDYGGTWSDLCGNFKVTGLFVMTGDDLYDEASFMTMFTCYCDEPDGCFRTPGYWKNHPEDPAWPDDGFAIGGVHYSNAELIAIMEQPVRGDATVILAHHLIAAKLNALAGEDDPDFMAAIDDGDAMLTMYPLGSKPGDPEKKDVLAAKDALVAYNELGCDDDDTFDKMDLGKDLPDEDRSSWGDLKSQYR